jgi:predicted  nucleic acid-binding Zn-ribbon protein
MQQDPSSRWLPELTHYCVVNVAYLNAAFKELEEKKQAIETKKSITSEDDLQKLQIRKSNLFGSRAKLSNQLIALPEGQNYDEKRAQISALIYEVQAQIESVFNEIDYAQGVKIRAIKEESTPKSLTELISRAKSIPVQISRFRKKIKGEKDSSKIDILNKKIADLLQEQNTINESISKIESNGKTV